MAKPGSSVTSPVRSAASIGPRARPRARRGSAQEALLRGGVALFARFSPDAVTIDEIVRESGVAKGSFYVHYAEKSTFVAAIGRQIRAEVEDRIAAACSGICDPLTRIAHAFVTAAAFARDHPQKAMSWSRIDDAQMAPDFALNATLRRDLAEAVARGQIAVRSERSAMLIVFALTRAATIHAASGQDSGTQITAELGIAMLEALGAAESDATSAMAAALSREVSSQ